MHLRCNRHLELQEVATPDQGALDPVAQVQVNLGPFLVKEIAAFA